MQYYTENIKNNSIISNLCFKRLLIIISIIFIASTYPNNAHAGVFSFFSDATSEIADAKTIERNSSQNSQNILVLHAAVNSDPNPNKKLNDAPLMSGNALVAEIGPSGTVSDIEKDSSNYQISLYVVREGDTLSDIADMFDVTPNTIIWANDIDKDTILYEGQKLVILPISGIKYTVKKGDTIRGIVTKHKTDLNEVLKYNDLTLSSTITAGDIIIIPDAEPTTENTSKLSIFKRNSNTNTKDLRLPYYPGYYIRPIEGGYRSQGLHGTNGVDLAASMGTPIRASAAGTVIVSKTGGWHGGYGNYVIISHSNGTQTLYAHTQKNFVSVGDYVEQGQLIARVGSTGNSTGPHVHFEIRGAKNPF